jgi:Lar family restriction alleviation protein
MNPILMEINLEKCNFDDECDFCKSPEGGSYAKLNHVPEDVTETEFYICGKCAIEKGYLVTLKPCPFCGAEARLKESYDVCLVGCTKCNAQVQDSQSSDPDFNAKEDAIKQWNKRVSKETK